MPAKTENIKPNTRKGHRCSARYASIVMMLKRGRSGWTAAMTSRRSGIALPGSADVRTISETDLTGLERNGTYVTGSVSTSLYCVLADVRHHPDDREPVVVGSVGLLVAESDATAHGITALQVHLGESLVDDGDLRPREAVIRTEPTTAHHLHSKRVRVAVAHPENGGLR